MQGVRTIRPSSAHFCGFWTFWAAKIGYFWRKYLECVCKASEGFDLLPPIFGVFELLDLFHYTTFLPYLPCLLPYLPAFRIFFSSFSRAGAPFGPLFENRPLLSYFGKKKIALMFWTKKIAFVMLKKDFVTLECVCKAFGRFDLLPPISGVFEPSGKLK